MAQRKSGQNDVLLAALAGLASLSATPSLANEDSSKVDMKEMSSQTKCFGIHEKGKNGCAVTPSQIKAANEHFKNKFPQSKPISCHGSATAASTEGFLAWIGVESEAECFKKKGFVLNRDEKGKFLVKEK